MARKIYKLFFTPFALIVIFLVSLSKFFLPIRFGIIPTDRFGHLAANIKINSAEKYILEKSSKKKVFDIYCFAGKIGNRTIKNLIKKNCIVLPEIFIDTIIFYLKKFNLSNFIIPNYSYGYDIYGLISKYTDAYKFNNNEKIIGYKSLQKININKFDKIVPFYIRDNLYNKLVFNEEGNYHDYRDTDIKNFQLAAEFLASEGYKVVRMGRITKDKIKEKKNVIDYSFSDIRNDFLDIFIPSESNFFLSANTGMETISTHLFKKSGVFTNFLPYFNIHFYKWVPYSILLPKKIKRDNKILSLEEIFTSDIFGFLDTNDYLKKNIEIVDNSPEEILESIKEYINYQHNKDNFLKGEDLYIQKSFWKMYSKNFQISLKFSKYGDIYYKKENNLDNQITSIISPYFLRKNFYSELI